MRRRILLLEPNYKNKYPPIGLMKIATYHRLLNDDVMFFKGELDDLVINNIYVQCLDKLNNIDESVNWSKYFILIKKFIKTKNKDILSDLPIKGSRYEVLLIHTFLDYSDYYRKKFYQNEPFFDRIYVATLFTFYWDITIKSIKFAKHLVKNKDQLFVGGVMASLIPKEIEKETGIKPIEGLLDRPNIFDNNHYVIDDLPLDYSILDEIDYEYPTKSAFFTFMTKGCTRKCAFCSVPKIEPSYKPKIPTMQKYEIVKDQFGDQQNLLLMDNNVLASPNFSEIIEEIKEMGFVKGAKFKEENQLDISIRNLKLNFNNKAYIKRCYKLLNTKLINLKNDIAQEYYNILDYYNLLKLETVTKENLLSAYPLLKDIYEKHRPKTSRNRYVDFNQGVDCRYVTEDYMSLISQIPIRPLRIAFDYISLKDKYIKAVELAAKYGIKELSNYILYNFTDSPEDLYNRLKINIELSENLGIHIFSFPMKYIPLDGEESKHRNYIGSKWNKKFIRAIQSVLNVTKGIVAPGRSFFEKAFGKDIDTYQKLLYMPEVYIVYRKVFEEHGFSSSWESLYSSLSPSELSLAQKIISTNDFCFLEKNTDNHKVIELLSHYKVTRKDINIEDYDYKILKTKYNKLIKKDQFLDLSITYDYDDQSLKLVN